MKAILTLLIALTACGGGEATDQEKVEADQGAASAAAQQQHDMTIQPVNVPACTAAGARL